MIAEPKFPPALITNNRVWTKTGFRDHGPMDGPRKNIAGPQGGRIISISKPYSTMDSLLYTIEWDNGQTSTHYAPDLIPIGDSANFESFLAEFSFVGPIELKVGPRGGFKAVSCKVAYRNAVVGCETRDRRTWANLIEPAAQSALAEIIESPF